MKWVILIILVLGLLPACSVSEKNIIGTYYPGNSRFSRLILKEDSTFECAMLHPQTDSLFLPFHSSLNYFTTGTWQYKNKKLLLQQLASPPPPVPGSIHDSIARFTSISCFTFWNRYGEPVSIRYIFFPTAKAKPHFGNTLYYFAQDFKETDTLRFYFDGYPHFDFPGSIPPAIGNNMHKITFIEPYHPDVFCDLSLLVKKNKLIYPPNKLKFRKKNFL